MQKLESIVRPFQLRGVSPPERYVLSGQRSSPPVICNWGRGGKGRTMNGSTSVTITAYLDQQIVEKKNS